MQITEGNVPLKTAAAVLGISQSSLKGALIAGALDIGAAWMNPGSTQYQYHISPQKLADYEGYEKREILELLGNNL